jgi:hypothetical protein
MEAVGNGDKYFGPLVQGKPHGEGKLECTEFGYTIEGEFRHGQIDYGSIVQTINGISYEYVGSIKDRRKHGKGYQTYELTFPLDNRSQSSIVEHHAIWV